MPESRRALPVVVVLLLTWVGGTLICRWALFGHVALDRPTVLTMGAVPLVQAALIAGWRRLRRRQVPS